MNMLSKLQRSRLAARFFARPAVSNPRNSFEADVQLTTSAQGSQGSFWQRFRPLVAVGMVGIVALVPVIGPLVEASIARLPNPPSLPVAALTALSLIQPTILMAGAVAAGVALTPKLGLRSHLVERAASGRPLWSALQAEAPLAVGLGTAAALAIIVGDLALGPLLGAQLQALSTALPHNTLAMTVAGVFAGGIYEELLMRWGLMTVLAWIGWRLLQKGQGLPRREVMVGAIAVAALLFGAGHLPATAMLVPLTPLIVLRALLLNGLAAVVYGWLFWRRSLEAAMISHATGHIVFTIVSLVGVWGR